MGHGPKVITFVDKDYLPIFDLWNKYFFRHGRNVKTVSLEGIIELDKSSYENYHKSLRYKNEYILKLLKLGNDIVHSDLDAFWISDPVKDLTKNDMVFSIDSGVSNRALKEWGFGLCFGLYYIKSTKNTIKLFEYFVEEWLFRYDNDQKAFNHMLLNRGVSWKNNKTTFMDVEIGFVNEKIASRTNIHSKVFHPSLGKCDMHEKILKLNAKGIR